MESFYQRVNPVTHSPNGEVMPVVEVRSNSFRDVSIPFQFNVASLTTSTSSKVLEYVLHPQTHLYITAFPSLSVTRQLYFCIN